jgi:hypothetical protein
LNKEVLLLIETEIFDEPIVISSAVLSNVNVDTGFRGLLTRISAGGLAAGFLISPPEVSSKTRKIFSP